MHKCTMEGCNREVTTVIAWEMRSVKRYFVAPYCESHGADIEADFGGLPASGPAVAVQATEAANA
jgi:hypothetical protein